MSIWFDYFKCLFTRCMQTTLWLKNYCLQEIRRWHGIDQKGIVSIHDIANHFVELVFWKLHHFSEEISVHFSKFLVKIISSALCLKASISTVARVCCCVKAVMTKK